MNRRLTLSSPELEITLRTISETDLENLRQWKNANRFSFFFQDIITPEQQRRWFRDYLRRANDYMFIVAHANHAIGCMGFRFIDNIADIYNVIRGDPDWGKRGSMGQAMRLMCSYLISDSKTNIIAQVLLSNPAIVWYQKNGFDRHSEHSNYVEMKLNLSRFEPCVVVRSQTESISDRSM